jgi:RimJ/RimL family protein N-acetyltransferase
MTVQVHSSPRQTPSQAAASASVSSLHGSPLVRLAPAEIGPALIAQYAATIACFWRDCHRRGLLQPDEPLDIVDVCPGRASILELLFAEVERRLHIGKRGGLRYLPLHPENLPGHDNPDSDHGPSADTREVPIRWHVADDQSRLQIAGPARSSLEEYRPGNPIVLIAHDAWSQLRQELFAMHYGRLLRADLELLADPQPAKDDALWQPVTDTAWDASLFPLIERYRTEFNSAPIVYPAGAFRLLGAAHSAAGRGLLVLSLAAGCTSDLALRLSSFAEISAGFRQSGRFPVNFQLLGRWAGNAGGVTAEIDLHGHRVLQAMLLGPVSSVPCLDAVVSCIDPALISSRAQLSEVARAMGAGVSLEARLNLLQLSRCDPAVFLAGAQGIIKELARSQEGNRRQWQQALEQVWRHHLYSPDTDRLSPLLAQAAMHCGHWGLARRILTDSMQRGNDAADIASLAWCEARTGGLEIGLSLVERAIALDSGHALANEIRRRLLARATQRSEPWLSELRHPELPLVLEPLDDSHTEAFSHQYRDPQIAVMTGLPAMSTPEEVRQWIIEQQSDAGRVNYAVMHTTWGFVGFINLAVSGSAAFFCFWTGVDFQGMGFATAAGRLACRHAAEFGVPVMLTSAYKDNHRSVRALKHLGFKELSIRACPPEQDRIFFGLIDARAGKVQPDLELCDYYRRENLPIAFDPSTYIDPRDSAPNEEQA